MPAPLAVMLHGGLASVLHDLLEDSIDALLREAAVQRPLLTLVEALCAHRSLLPVLTAPSDWPQHLLAPADKAAAATAAPPGAQHLLVPRTRMPCTAAATALLFVAWEATGCSGWNHISCE